MRTTISIECSIYTRADWACWLNSAPLETPTHLEPARDISAFWAEMEATRIDTETRTQEVK